MPEFKYRLQVLLDRKLEAKEHAQLALAERQKELAEEVERLERAMAEQRRIEQVLAERRNSGMQGGASAYSIKLWRDYLRGLAADLEASKDAVFSQELRRREAEDRVAEARRQLAECSREVEVLKKHRERLEKRFLREIERKQALEQDEMGVNIFQRRMQAS